jgi:PAS domain S-box-containing protein
VWLALLGDADQAFLDVAADVTAALDDVPLATALFDSAGKIRWQNKASIALRGHRVGLDFADVVAPEHKQEARSVFTRMLAREGPEELLVRALNADGEYVSLQARWSAVPLRDGSTVVVVFSLGDMAAAEAPPAAADQAPQLTQRQSEVLKLLAGGSSTDEIAAALSLNRTTVRNYIANLLAALDVHSRLQAVVAAREAGLLDS